ANSQVTGGTWNAEYRVIPPPSHRHAGETRWVAVESSVVRNAQGLPASLRGVTRDITDRKRAEQALAESSAQIELASKIGRVGSFTIDLAKSRVRLSPGCASILGLPEGTLEITRDEARKLVHPDDLVHLDTPRDQAFLKREGEFVAQF